MKRLSILLAAMLLIASAGQAETLEPVVTPAAELTEALETTIRATGTESVPLPADIVVLTLCVQGSGDNVTTAQDKAAAWDFMKWWTDTDTQVSYSREMESLLGTSAR